MMYYTGLKADNKGPGTFPRKDSVGFDLLQDPQIPRLPRCTWCGCCVSLLQSGDGYGNCCYLCVLLVELL